MSTFISMLVVVIFGWLLMAPLIIPPCWQLCRRWGYSPTLSLLLLVPCWELVILILLLQSPRSNEPGIARRS